VQADVSTDPDSFTNETVLGAETHLPLGGWKETPTVTGAEGLAAFDSYTGWTSI